MKVCLDIQSAIAQRAGVGRYTKMLATHLGEAKQADELDFFYFDFKRQGEPFNLPHATSTICRWIPGRIVQKAWKEWNVPPFNYFAGKADVYHFPNFIRPPLTRGRSVITIHDVSFLRYPETMEKKNFHYMNGKIRASVERADAIICDCSFVAEEVHEHLNVTRNKLFPIHLGLSAHMKRPPPEKIAEVKSRLKLDQPYLLHVGTVEPRKNHSFLFDLFDRLEDFDGQLVFTGMRGWKTDSIFKRLWASPRASSIRYLEYVRDEDLPALYAGAEMFIFPSLYEGFGFPPLEAMACETPVLASDAGSLAEVLGEGACLLSNFDSEHWLQEIRGLLHDRLQRERLVKKGLAQTRTYNWHETAKKTWEVYRSVIS